MTALHLHSLVPRILFTEWKNHLFGGREKCGLGTRLAHACICVCLLVWTDHLPESLNSVTVQWANSESGREKQAKGMPYYINACLAPPLRVKPVLKKLCDTEATLNTVFCCVTP